MARRARSVFESTNGPRIARIVITGGPCAGKSTGLTFLREQLESRGVTPLVVPETATAIFSSGLRVKDMLESPEKYVSFQAEMIRTQLATEDQWHRFAMLMPGERKVLICDRGAMDPMAYMGPDAFADVITRLGLSIEAIRDARYDAVFHLVTAARGAEEFYTTANNAARSESPAEAVALDERTAAAWQAHPAFSLIANTEPGPDGRDAPTTFARKLERLWNEVSRALDIAAPDRTLSVRRFPARLVAGRR